MIKKHDNRGFALLLAMIVAGVVVSIGLSLLSITLKQLDLRMNTRGSEVAFQAAAAGMDCVRFLRNAYPTQFTEDGGTVPVECFDLSGVTISDTDSVTWRQQFSTQLDWSTAVGNRCLDIEVVVLNATADARSYTPSGRPTITCDSGDICTTAWVAGYNTACTNISGNNNAVQRELTASF